MGLDFYSVTMSIFSKLEPDELVYFMYIEYFAYIKDLMYNKRYG